MRIFLISLLAVGALAGDVPKKSTEHKQVKRGFIPSSGSVNGGQESSQDFVYDQLRQGAYGYSVSSQPIQRKVIRPMVDVPVPHPVPVTRNVQVSVPRPYPVEVRRPVEVPVPGPVPVYVNKPYAFYIDRPVPVSIPVPYDEHVPVQVSVPHPVSVEVPHQETVQVSHHEPVQGGYQESVQFVHQEPVQIGYQETVQVSHQEPIQLGHQESVQVSHQEPIHIGSGYGEQNYGQYFGAEDAFYGQGQVNEQQITVSENTAPLGNLGGFEHLKVGTQHYNFGSSELETDLASAHHNTKTVHHHQQPIQKGSSVSKDGNGGYVYNVPDKKFIF